MIGLMMRRRGLWTGWIGLWRTRGMVMTMGWSWVDGWEWLGIWSI